MLLMPQQDDNNKDISATQQWQSKYAQEALLVWKNIFKSYVAFFMAAP